MSCLKLVPVFFAFAILIVTSERRANLGQWEAWKEQYGKVYSSRYEEIKRYNIFNENIIKVEVHNYEAELGLHNYDLEINHFADLTIEEFKTTMNGYLVSNQERKYRQLPNKNIPDSIDWRQKGAVTPVKRQGNCGSCWAFSTTGSLEGMVFLKTNKSVNLSEQNLIDCSYSYGNHGCNGGTMDQAFKYVIDNDGLDSENAYPYKGIDSTCKFNSSNTAAKMLSYFDVPSGSEEELKKAVGLIGPISVGIDASSQNFQFYKSGVYIENNCSSVLLDRGVLVVGYGTTEENIDYWIVKNSWSIRWGDKGYIKMARNRQNMCGIATSASYPKND